VTMRLGLVAAVAVSLVLVGLAVVLTPSQPRLAGSNGVTPAAFTVVVPAGATVCQEGQTVPAGTGALRFLAGTYDLPGGPVAVRIQTAGRTVTAGARSAAFGNGELVVPVRRVAEGVSPARVCLRNGGRGRLALAGLPNPGAGPVVAGRPQDGPATIEFLRAGNRSGWALIPSVAERAGRARGGLTSGWAFWGALVLLAAAWGVAIAVVVRGGRS